MRMPARSRIVMVWRIVHAPIPHEMAQQHHVARMGASGKARSNKWLVAARAHPKLLAGRCLSRYGSCLLSNLHSELSSSSKSDANVGNFWIKLVGSETRSHFVNVCSMRRSFCSIVDADFVSWPR